MNKPVQILLLFALLPMVGTAREETLEERKQRIVRKYLRENATITQSEMVVPSDLPEDERITDSEKFKEAEINLQREEGNTAAPAMRPPPRARPARQVDRNWLMGDMDETGDAGDPYASSGIDAGEDLWPTWGEQPYEKGETDSSRKRQSYDPRSDPYARQDTRTSILDGNNAQQQDSRYGESTSFGNQDGFGRGQRSSTYSSSLNLQGDRARTYGTDPAEGMLTTPYSRSTDGTSSTERESTQGYQPYKSPYQQGREQRQQKWNAQPKPAEQEYKRTDSYEQWKERNKTWNPTQDDAYISEMMKQNNKR